MSDADALQWSGTSGRFHQDKVAVVCVDRQGVKNTLNESARTQSNVSVTDDEIRKNPKLAAAAILVELMRDYFGHWPVGSVTTGRTLAFSCRYLSTPAVGRITSAAASGRQHCTASAIWLIVPPFIG